MVVQEFPFASFSAVFDTDFFLQKSPPFLKMEIQFENYFEREIRNPHWENGEGTGKGKLP